MIQALRDRVAAHPRVRAVREFLIPPRCEGARLSVRRLLNLYRARWEEARGATTLRSKPIRMTVEATNVCNLQCPACFTGAGERGRPRSHLSLDLYRRLLDELGPTLFALEFYNWGEPLLGKHIFAMIEAAHRLGISTIVSTNFSLPFDAERAERLVASGLSILGVSLDGARQETYQQYRVGGDFETVLCNVRLVTAAKARLAAATPRVVWEFHVFAHNEADVPVARAMAAELGIDISVTKGWTIGPEWNPISEHKFPWYPFPPARCRFLWQDAIVHNDGGVAPCCGTFYKADDVGHLRVTRADPGAGSFAEVWNGPAMVQARELFRSRTGGDRDHVCHDCPITVLWERWQTHLASGGRVPVEGFSPNDCFNYFWGRRPAPLSVPERVAAR